MFEDVNLNQAVLSGQYSHCETVAEMTNNGMMKSRYYAYIDNDGRPYEIRTIRDYGYENFVKKVLPGDFVYLYYQDGVFNMSSREMKLTERLNRSLCDFSFMIKVFVWTVLMLLALIDFYRKVVKAYNNKSKDDDDPDDIYTEIVSKWTFRGVA